MKKLNILNNIYVVILFLLVTGIIVKLWKYGGSSRYYYVSSVSVPKTHPVRVLEANWILADGDTEYITTESANDFNSDWGQDDFNQANEQERLPVKLILSYVSYRDEHFYKDTINLPSSRIDSIFKSSNKTGIKTSLYSYNNGVEGLNFVVGIANKGNIIVWLRGKNYEVTLLKHKISPKDQNEVLINEGKKLSKKEYFKEVFYIGEYVQGEIDKVKDKDENYIDSASRYIENGRF